MERYRPQYSSDLEALPYEQLQEQAWSLLQNASSGISFAEIAEHRMKKIDEKADYNFNLVEKIREHPVIKATLISVNYFYIPDNFRLTDSGLRYFGGVDMMRGKPVNLETMVSEVRWGTEDFVAFAELDPKQLLRHMSRSTLPSLTYRTLFHLNKAGNSIKNSI